MGSEVINSSQLSSFRTSYPEGSSEWCSDSNNFNGNCFEELCAPPEVECNMNGMFGSCGEVGSSAPTISFVTTEDVAYTTSLIATDSDNDNLTFSVDTNLCCAGNGVRQ